MIFTSGTQALQNRTVNHDATPWLGLPGHTNTPNRYATREMGEGAPFWDTVTYAPCPEFAVLDNTVLAEFRKIKNKYGTVADSARWCLENGVWEPDSPLLGGLDVAHARKVLTRLAQWKEN